MVVAITGGAALSLAGAAASAGAAGGAAGAAAATGVAAAEVATTAATAAASSAAAAAGAGAAGSAAAGAGTAMALGASAAEAAAGTLTSSTLASGMLPAIAAGGPVAWLAVGALAVGLAEEEGELSYDCWRKVVDEDDEASAQYEGRGMPLQTLLGSRQVTHVLVRDGGDLGVRNVRGKYHRLVLSYSDGDLLGLHAVESSADEWAGAQILRGAEVKCHFRPRRERARGLDRAATEALAPPCEEGEVEEGLKDSCPYGAASALRPARPGLGRRFTAPDEQALGKLEEVGSPSAMQDFLSLPVPAHGGGA